MLTLQRAGDTSYYAFTQPDWLHGTITGRVRWSPKRHRLSFRLLVPQDVSSIIGTATIPISILTTQWHSDKFAKMNLEPDAPIRVRGVYYPNENIFNMINIENDL